MTTDKHPAQNRLRRSLAMLVVPAFLLIVAVEAVTSMSGDSVTWDETGHLAAGMSYLKTGDFRMSAGHPPLANVVSALPLLWAEHTWPGPDAPGWRQGNLWRVGRHWLFHAGNAGHRLVMIGRCVTVVVLLLTCICVYVLGRRLFGRPAGFLALFLTGQSPNIIAHGRLVTTDMAAALGVLVVLLTFHRLTERISPGRLLAASLSVGALALIKYSWPLVLLPLGVMSAFAVLRSSPLEVTLRLGRSPRCAAVQGRRARLAVIAGCWVVAAAIVWASVWTCFAWRSSPFAGDSGRDSSTMMATSVKGQPRARTMDEAWKSVLTDLSGQPIEGVGRQMVTWVREHRLLPEAYLYGLMFTLKTASRRESYLGGEISATGRWSYFPVAIAVKTPLPSLILLVLGTATLVLRRGVVRCWALLTGVVSFALGYLLVAVLGNINIGIRHLLPVLPLFHLLAAAAATWLGARRWAGPVAAIALGWLAVTNIRTFPHYLSYFNEIAGGPDGGHRFLVDSNLDWGQDLIRLAEFARRQPAPIKLAYFGSADPRHYGIRAEMLPSSFPKGPPFGPPARLEPGIYVVSATQLYSLYDPISRPGFWQNEQNRRAYRRLLRQGRNGTTVTEWLDQLQRHLLIYRLRQRSPDLHVGHSLFVYRLDQSDLDRLLVPP